MAGWPLGATVPFKVAALVLTPVAVPVTGVGAAAGSTVVGSPAALLPGLVSPPPEATAVLVTLAGALAETLTVTLIGG